MSHCKFGNAHVITDNHGGQCNKSQQQQSLSHKQTEYLFLRAAHGKPQSYFIAAPTGTEPESTYQPQEHIHQQEYYHNRLRIHLVHIAFHHLKLILLLRVRSYIGNEHIVGVQMRGYLFQELAPVIGRIHVFLHTENNLRFIIL